MSKRQLQKTLSKAPKIVVVPLARLGPSSTSPLVYYHTSLPPLPAGQSLSQSSTKTEAPRSRARLIIEDKLKFKPNAPLLLQLQLKATDLWVGLADKKEGSWQVRSHRYGERLMDRIDYREWSLKTLERGLLPPGLLADPNVENKTGDNELKESTDPAARSEEKQVITLLYPKMLGPDPVADLKAFVVERAPYHQKMFRRSLVLIPFTGIFGLIPIIPNFVFFFVAWRSWSHWKARNAAQIILELIQSERIVPQESTTLSQIYSSNPAPNLAETESGSGGSRGEMLIAPEGIETIVTKEELGSVGTEELTRSLGQAKLKLEAYRKTIVDSNEDGEKIHPKNLDLKTSPSEEVGGQKGKSP